MFPISGDHLLRLALVSFTFQFTSPFGIVVNGDTNTNRHNSADIAQILGPDITGKNRKQCFLYLKFSEKNTMYSNTINLRPNL